MAYDEGQAQLLRDHLAHYDGITERKMFGGLCFMYRGNMLCGVHTKGGMARVGKDNMDAALALDGIAPLSFTGRPMGGMVDVADEVFEDDARRDEILRLCFDFVGALAAK
jgi:TfoX/Sxy family transcriptional regulator of competence genes